MSYVMLAVLVLLSVSTASAQNGPGLWQAAPNTGIPQCTSIGSPVTNRTWCFDGNNTPNYTIKVWDGTQYVTILGGGGGGGLAGTGDWPHLARWKNGVTNTLENSTVVDTGTEFAVFDERVGIYNNPLRLYDATGTNWVGFLSPAIMTNHYTCRWPVDSGTAGQQLTTDGGGDTCILSWTNPTSLGISGKAQICGTATTAVVTFGTASPNATYAVVLGTEPASGTPPHVTADYNTPTVNGFNVEISAQPGVGNCVNVSWATGAGPSGGGGGSPGPPDTSVQFNDGGTFGGASLRWDKATNTLHPSVDPTFLGTTALPFRTAFLTGKGDNFNVGVERSGLVVADSDTGELSQYLDLPVKSAISIMGDNFFYDFGLYGLNKEARSVSFTATGGTWSAPNTVNVAGTLLWSHTVGGRNTSLWNVKNRIGSRVGPDGNHGEFYILTGGDAGTGGGTWFFTYPGRVTTPAVAFANLGNPGTFSISNAHVFCSNCDPTATLLPCTHVGTQTGAYAFWSNGAWKCIG